MSIYKIPSQGTISQYLMQHQLTTDAAYEENFSDWKEKHMGTVRQTLINRLANKTLQWIDASVIIGQVITEKIDPERVHFTRFSLALQDCCNGIKENLVRKS